MSKNKSVFISYKHIGPDETLAHVLAQTLRGEEHEVFIDTGIDKDHPDLIVVGGFNFFTGGVDPADWDDALPECNQHGTLGALAAAARDNLIDVVGVAPEVELYSLLVFDALPDCLSFASVIVAAIEYAVVVLDLDVVNMSFGSLGKSIALGDAVRDATAAGLVVVSSNTP